MSAECGALPRHPASSGSSRFEWGNWSCRGNSSAGPAFDREFKPPHRPLAQNAMWPPCSINIVRSGRLAFAVAARDLPRLADGTDGQAVAQGLSGSTSLIKAGASEAPAIFRKRSDNCGSVSSICISSRWLQHMTRVGWVAVKS